MRVMTIPADAPALRMGWDLVPWLALFFFGYSAAAALAIGLGNNNTPIFWPPCGIYVGALMLAPRRAWPAFMVTAAFAELLCDLLFYRFSFSVSAGLVFANTLEVVSAAYLVRRNHAEPMRFAVLHHHILRVALAFAVGPAVGAILGATVTTSIAGGNFCNHGFSWWVGDTLGMLVFAPLTLLLVSPWPRQVSQLNARQWFELGALTLISAVLFHTIFTHHLPIAYVALLPLLWAALRFGLAGIVVSVAALSLVACRYTMLGLGPFAHQGNPQVSAWMVELFVGVVGFSALVVAAFLQQRVDARRGLRDAERDARAQLEQRVAERTAALQASEQRYRSLVTAAHDSIWTLDAQGQITSATESITGKDWTELGQGRWQDSVHPDDLPGVLSGWQLFTATKPTTRLWEHEHRLKDKNGEWRDVVWRVAHVLDQDGALREWIGTTTDITLRKRAEQAVAASERRFRSLVMAANQSIWTVDAGGNLSTITRSISGKSESELKGHAWLNTVHPDDLPSLSACWEAFKAAGTRASLFEHEHRVHDAGGAWRNVVARAAPVMEDDDTVREWIGTTTDITERKQAERALRNSEQRYRTLVAATSHSVWTMDAQANVLTTTNRIGGRSDDKVLGRGWLEAIYPDDRAEALQRLTATHPPVAFEQEARMTVRDETRIVLARAAPIFDESGAFREWIGTTTDITERVRTEEALRLSEERYRTLVSASGQHSVWVLDAEGNMLALENSVLKRSLDTATPDRKQWMEWVHPEDRAKVVQHFEAMLQTRAACSGEAATLRMRAADGTWRTVQIAAAPLLNADGSVREIIGRTVDITEQAQAQEALRVSEERYRTLVTASQQSVWVLDPEGNMTSLSNSLLARDLEQSSGKQWLQWIHPDDREMAWQRCLTALHTAAPYDGEQRMLAADGTVRNVFVQVVPVLNADGSLRDMIGTGRDITEQKRAEQALKDSEERYRTLIEASQQGVWVFDCEGNMIALHNSAAKRSLSECLGKRWLDWIHPEDRELSWKRCETALRERMPYQGEQRMLASDGTWRTIQIQAVPLLNSDGSLRQLIGTSADITERKQAEQSLKASEQRFRTLVYAANQGVWTADSRGHLLTLERPVTGRDIEEVNWNAWMEAVHPDDRLALRQAFEAAVPNGSLYEHECRLKNKQGEWRNILVRAAAVLEDDGSVREWIGTTTDITERKCAEEALRVSEERYRTLLNASQQSVWVLDPQGNMVAVHNSVAKRDLADSAGKAWLNWIHPNDRARVWAGFETGLREGKAVTLEMRISDVNGSWLQVQSLGVPLLNQDGSLREFIGTTIDMTERKKAEMALRETADSLRRLAARQEELLEAERVRIAHDLHDGVGQLLNVIKLKVATSLKADAPRAQLQEVAQIIDQTNSAIRTLEFELSPPVLRELGLVPALNWLAEEMQRQYKLSVSVIDDRAPKPLDQLSRAVVFRAARELLINVARHARTASAQVEVRRTQDSLELIVNDAGVGFDADSQEAHGLGLVGVRERIAAVGGSSELHSRPGMGVTVSLRVPLQPDSVALRAQP